MTNELTLKEIYEYALKGIEFEGNHLFARAALSDAAEREKLVEEFNELGRKVDMLKAMLKYCD